jgi:hypothetical protein
MSNHSFDRVTQTRVADNAASWVGAPLVISWTELTATLVTLGAPVLWGGALLLSAAHMHSLAQASDVLAPRLYEVVSETGMPHLEENLRYTITREERCLSEADLASAFPVLSHAALKGCTLGDETRQDDTVSYALACEGGHGTTGHATWRIGEHQISGLLSVRLGGKNLTFYQRITGKPLGACD